MGSLAERLARRLSPLIVPAKELVREARSALDGDPSDLDDALVWVFGDYDAFEVEDLMDLAVEEAELLADDGEEVEKCLLNRAHHVAQSIDVDDGEDHVLFALTIAVRGFFGDTHYKLTEDQQEAIGELLQDSELIAEDSEVVLLPTAMSAEAANQLGLKDVFETSRALFFGDSDGGQMLLEQQMVPRPKGASTPKRSKAGKSSKALSAQEDLPLTYLVLIGMVSCADGVPFVLARLSDAEHDALPETAAPEFSEMHEDLHNDLEAHLSGGVSAALEEILAVDQVVVFPPDAWHKVRDLAFMLEREDAGRRQLQAIADEHCGGDLGALTMYQPGMDDDGDMAFPVHRRVDKAPLGVIEWRQAASESYPHSIFRMIKLARDIGVQPDMNFDENDAPTGPLH